MRRSDWRGHAIARCRSDLAECRVLTSLCHATFRRCNLCCWAGVHSTDLRCKTVSRGPRNDTAHFPPALSEAFMLTLSPSQGVVSTTGNICHACIIRLSFACSLSFCIYHTHATPSACHTLGHSSRVTCCISCTNINHLDREDVVEHKAGLFESESGHCGGGRKVHESLGLASSRHRDTSGTPAPYVPHADGS